MAGRKKHLIVIHGRSTKPSYKEKLRLVKQSMLHGLDRVDTDAAQRLRKPTGPNGVKLTFAYYGDLSNKLILEKKPEKLSRLSGTDPDYGDQRCEPDGFYDAGLDLLFAQNSHTKAAYKKFLRENPDRSWMNNVGSVLSVLGNISGFSDELLAAATADMGAYLLTRQWGSAMRERLQNPLKKSIKAGDDVCLVAHSMGCMISYDVLWKFSRMSEYRDVMQSENPVTKWITLGSPLGEPGVRKNLYDADEREDGMYPTGIIKDWVNMSAVDDFICHDMTVKDDFKNMKKRGHVGDIRDVKLYNFWLGATHTNPHKFYGYLDNPTVAREIASWINS